MKKELEIWKFVAEHVKRKQNVMLLVVAESSGSSPGRQGFKMIVTRDEICGSIGGGVMEVTLVENARRLLGTIEGGFIKVQIHRRNLPHSSGMICSGEQTVILFALGGEHFELVRKIPSYLKGLRGRYLHITQNEFVVAAKKLRPFDFKFKRYGEDEFVYEERLGFKNELFIVGGGHCALALSEIVSKMDFHITLFDDRPNLNTLEKNKFVHEKKIVESYAQIDEFIPAGANHFVVVMTLGYKTDETVIRRLIGKDFKYFGVLGSLGKMATLLKNLRREGFSEEKLNRIRTPIGLPINSRTPEEIAVSIAAEIIAVKNKTA
jgi:xanthine dehydrogenase accessory factor